MNKGEGQMEDSIHDIRRVVWTNCNVLWTSNSPATF